MSGADSSSRVTTWVTHVRTQLALHRLRSGEGRPLLLLHGLAEHSPEVAPDWTESWEGPVYGLDLGGHGESSRCPGGGYTAEIMMADVDAVLAEIGPVTIVGRGLGAYVALLVSGARPALVVGAVLCDGPGLAGGGPAPHSPAVISPVPDVASVGGGGDRPAAPDPFVLAEMATDVRPRDYATTYVRQALQFSGLEHPVAVCAVARPPWVDAVVGEPGVVVEELGEALDRYQHAAAVPVEPPTMEAPPT